MWNEAVPKVADHNAWELPPFHKLPRIRGYWTAKWEEDMCNRVLDPPLHFFQLLRGGSFSSGFLIREHIK